ncbi:hypothetical protein BSZ39_09400 [Bowdeniella nasicola]|uniref:Uncharacterized protein n=1 Tax=Bowdeniella nasicola TaxID=208480 RepID=A0A1Q5Q145_9ACTO|nr:hypothetical protein [Bowdeniella nasicola]OKL53455.1 hypothetical protein BSZ39_09400 [Bowdeniella nasicola]
MFGFFDNLLVGVLVSAGGAAVGFLIAYLEMPPKVQKKTRKTRSFAQRLSLMGRSGKVWLLVAALMTISTVAAVLVLLGY